LLGILKKLGVIEFQIQLPADGNLPIEFIAAAKKGLKASGWGGTKLIKFRVLRFNWAPRVFGEFRYLESWAIIVA
jgi:hypothetical protein